MSDNLVGKLVKELQKLGLQQPSAPLPEKMTRGADFSRWEARIKDYLHGVDTSSQSRTILGLLDDEVYDLAQSSGMSTSMPASDILDGLRAILGAPVHPWIMQSELRDRLQQPGEGVLDYQQALRLLRRRAFPTMDAAALTQRVSEQFIAGVRDHEVRKALMRGQPATLDKALDLTCQEEALQAVCDRPAQPLLGIVAVRPQTVRDSATQTPWRPCSCGTYYPRQNQWRRPPPRRGSGPQTRRPVQAIDVSTEEHGDTTLDALAGNIMFSTLDLASDYWQVEVRPSDGEKTAFAVPSGLYEFETMPFGLANAPSTFQRLMNQVLAQLIPTSCLVYMDDIIVLGKDFDSHLKNIRAVFNSLRQAGLTLKPSKCIFIKSRMKFLGHVVSAAGIETEDEKVTQIRFKSPGHSYRAPLQPIKTGYPNERVAVDLVGPIASSAGGNRFILVMVDCFTKMAEAVPLPDASALTVARAIFNGWICRWGVPDQPHSDRGSSFESSVVHQLCKVLKIKKTRTTAYHPQGNGQVERTNRTLINLLRAFVDRNSTSTWDEALPACMLAYRSTVNATTQHKPFFLTCGREMQPPEDLHLPPTHLVGNVDTYASRKARLHLQEGQRRQKAFYDGLAHGTPYQEGDIVWMRSFAPSPGVPQKFNPAWIGPYVVRRVLSDTTCVVRSLDRPYSEEFTVHFNRLKPGPSTEEDTGCAVSGASSSHAYNDQPVERYLEVPPEGGYTSAEVFRDGHPVEKTVEVPPDGGPAVELDDSAEHSRPFSQGGAM
ncbi:hypothetical protein SprV_0501767600 [Sparganum proliferum]